MGQGCEFCDGERPKAELEGEQTVDVFVVAEERRQVVEKAAKDDDGRALDAAHTVEQLVQLIHLACLGGGQEFLRVGYQKYAVFQSGYVTVEVRGELTPIGGIHRFGSRLHDAGSFHLVGDDASYEGLARTGVAQDQAVEVDFGPALCEHSGHLEFAVEVTQDRDDCIFAYEALLRGLLRFQRLSAETAVFRLGAVVFRAMLTGHFFFISSILSVTGAENFSKRSLLGRKTLKMVRNHTAPTNIHM